MSFDPVFFRLPDARAAWTTAPSPLLLHAGQQRLIGGARRVNDAEFLAACFIRAKLNEQIVSKNEFGGKEEDGRRENVPHRICRCIHFKEPFLYFLLYLFSCPSPFLCSLVTHSVDPFLRNCCFYHFFHCFYFAFSSPKLLEKKIL